MTFDPERISLAKGSFGVIMSHRLNEKRVVHYKYREERGTASSFSTTPNYLLRNSNTGKTDFTKCKVRRGSGK